MLCQNTFGFHSSCSGSCHPETKLMSLENYFIVLSTLKQHWKNRSKLPTLVIFNYKTLSPKSDICRSNINVAIASNGTTYNFCLKCPYHIFKFCQNVQTLMPPIWIENRWNHQQKQPLCSINSPLIFNNIYSLSDTPVNQFNVFNNTAFDFLLFFEMIWSCAFNVCSV